jgi:hypothetical protein
MQSCRHIEVDPDHNGNLFFWHYQNRHIANRQRTVIWLNGGPGCSSMDGALMEVGPYRLKNDTTLEYNDGSWDEFANLLFVDQPVGTGFSYVNSNSYLHELDQVGEHFLVFLEKFFNLFPQYQDDDVRSDIHQLCVLVIANQSFDSSTLLVNLMLASIFLTSLRRLWIETSKLSLTPTSASGTLRVFLSAMVGFHRSTNTKPISPTLTRVE